MVRLFCLEAAEKAQLLYTHCMGDQKKPVIFRSFDPRAEFIVTAGNLPHWFQVGAAMFITFRTADSLPKDVLLRWQRELEHWLATNHLPVELAASTTAQKSPRHDEFLNALNAAQRHEFKKLSDRIFHRSLDECHGECLLKQVELAEIAANALLFYDDAKYDLDRLVVMPNHVHAIVQFREGASLDVVGQSWMRYTARQINASINRSGVFWQPEPFDHLIRSPEQFEYLQRYVFDNPKKANLRKGEFLYWEREM
ncbi:transposase [Stieleria mannarensis]|uniref:transposase n=1 Tax=Stieleria mannarensis TaxID=2755585 RepID=UPI002570E1E2|nr:transposase [Rhodopirellula sp. JC639]